MFFEIVSEISLAVKNYLTKFEIVEKDGPFSSTLILPEIIREYDELVFGSHASIKLSFYLKRHNIDIGPEEVARDLFTYLKSDATKEYFIGRGVYVNATINHGEVFKSMIDAGDGGAYGFLSKSDIVDDVLLRVAGEGYRNLEFAPAYESIAKMDSLSKVSETLSIKEKKLVYLSKLSDPEFEEEHLIKDYPSRDNPIWIFSEFERIIDFYFWQRVGEVEFHESAIKSSLHTVPASHNALNKAYLELVQFASLYDYYLFDSIRRSKPEIFWVYVLKLERTLISLWNDPWIRLAIEGRSVKGDNGELDSVFRILRIFRSGIVSLLN